LQRSAKSIFAIGRSSSALTVNAVKLPWEWRPCAVATSDLLADAVALDMNG
jgi:ParB family chromosome partitioning protein